MPRIPLFMKNIEFIRDITRISQKNFCGRTDSWESWGTDTDWSDLTTYKDKIKVLRISANTYTNYMNGSFSPEDDIRKQTELVEDLNEIRKRHPVLKKCFRSEITRQQLFEHDMKNECDDTVSAERFLFTEKFLGNYLCYYTSTNIKGEKTTQTGVLQLEKGNSDNEYNAKGVFSLKKGDDAQKIYSLLQEGKSLTDIVCEVPNINVFSGKAVLSINLLWINLSDDAQKEHACFSFDLSQQVTQKHPDKPFMGAKGIALSQSSGLSSRTTTFPIVILSQPLSVSFNDLTKYLHFDYTEKIQDETLEKLSQKAVTLMTSLLQNDDIDETLRLKLISQIIEHELKDLLSKHIFNSGYYRDEELDNFYASIIRPLRQQDTQSEVDVNS